MKPVPLLSVVICYRNWGSERLRLAVESHLRSNTLDGVEIIVSDFGSEADGKAEHVLSDLPVRTVYTSTSEPWSRGRALNAGIAQARGTHILAWDADIICGPDLHEILLSHFEAQPEAVYVFQCRDLDEAFAEEQVGWYLEQDRDLPLEAMRDHSTWRPRWGMGIAAFRRRDFDLVRGYDERFVIWGGEDRDLVNRFSRVGLPARWIEHERAEIYHIFHESSMDKARETAVGQSAVARNHYYVLNDSTIYRNLSSPIYFSSSRPLVSVVIATYNRASYIRESVESVLNQSVSDLEVLVVDDGSTDGTADVLDSISDERLKVIRKENGGVASARNEGARAAVGHFIVVHDDDDIMLPDRIEFHLKSLECDKAGSYGGWIDFDGETGQFMHVNQGKEFSPESIAHAGKVLLHPTVMTTRWVARRIPYDVRYQGGSDFNWMMSIADAGCELVHTGRIHILRRVHGNSLTSSDSGQKHASRAAVRSVYSAAGTGKVRSVRQRGRDTLFHPSEQSAALYRLYQFLPASLRRERVRFEATVNAGDFHRLAKQLSRDGANVVVESIEPMAAGVAYTPDIWRVSGWVESEEVLKDVFDPSGIQYDIERIAAPLVLDSGAGRVLFARPGKPSASGWRSKLGRRLPDGIWQLLARISVHKGIDGSQLILALRARTRNAISVRKADRLMQGLGRGARAERLAIIRAPDGAIPLYSVTGDWKSSGWITKLSQKWVLNRIAVTLIEPGECDSNPGNDAS